MKKIRSHKSITITELASKLGVSKVFVSAVENGKRPVPKQWLPSLISILKVNEEDLKVYQQFQVPPWLEKRVPNGFWDEEKNRQWFFEWLTKELKLSCISELLSLSNTEIRKKIAFYGGAGMFQSYYKYSLMKALSMLFPEISQKLKVNKNQAIPLGASKNQLAVRSFLENMFAKLGYRQVEDFYKISCTLISKNGGDKLVQLYRPAPYAIMKFAFPEHEWQPWKFAHVSSGFWDDTANLRNYLEWLSKQLGYKGYEDFYHISHKDFRDHDGSGLLSLSGKSPSAVIIRAFPEYDWRPWLFNKTPKNYWHNESNKLTYLKWLEKKLDINNPKDWYTITRKDFVCNNGGGLLSMYQGSPARAAQALYPEIEWNLREFGVKKKRQQKLYVSPLKFMVDGKISLIAPTKSFVFFCALLSL